MLCGGCWGCGVGFGVQFFHFKLSLGLRRRGFFVLGWVLLLFLNAKFSPLIWLLFIIQMLQLKLLIVAIGWSGWGHVDFQNPFELYFFHPFLYPQLFLYTECQVPESVLCQWVGQGPIYLHLMILNLEIEKFQRRLSGANRRNKSVWPSNLFGVWQEMLNP